MGFFARTTGVRSLADDNRHIESPKNYGSADWGPRVRIHLPPADSPSLARIRYQAWRTPAFRAGVRGWLGDRVGRDAQGVSISRQPAAISLPDHIPVPQCR